MTHYLRALRQWGHAKKPRSRTSESARVLGYTQDIVKMESTGALVTVFAAQAYYGNDWYKRTKPTDLEALTNEGNRALQELDNAG
jgi:hypothetical protein